MPDRNINLTLDMDRYITERVQSGQYSDASEVIGIALRTLEREEQEQMKWKALEAALEEGMNSGIAKGDVWGRVRQKAGLASRKPD